MKNGYDIYKGVDEQGESLIPFREFCHRGTKILAVLKLKNFLAQDI